MTQSKWKLVTPVRRAPWIAGDELWRTHVLAENERGERYFVHREEVGNDPE